MITDILKIVVPSLVSVISMIIIWKISSKNVDKQIKAGKENLEKRIEIDLRKETLNLKWSKYFEIFSNLSVMLQKWLKEVNLLINQYDDIAPAEWYLPDEVRDILNDCMDFSRTYVTNPVLNKNYDSLSEQEKEMHDNLIRVQQNLVSKLEDCFRRYLDNIHE